MASGSVATNSGLIVPTASQAQIPDCRQGGQDLGLPLALTLPIDACQLSLPLRSRPTQPVVVVAGDDERVVLAHRVEIERCLIDMDQPNGEGQHEQQD